MADPSSAAPALSPDRLREIREHIKRPPQCYLGVGGVWMIALPEHDAKALLTEVDRFSALHARTEEVQQVIDKLRLRYRELCEVQRTTTADLLLEAADLLTALTLAPDAKGK